MKSVWFGYLMKGLSILAKIYFIFIVSASLLPGAYAEYYYLFSVALIISRVIGFGASDTLPSILYNDVKKALSLLSSVLILQFFLLFLLVFYFYNIGLFSAQIVNVLCVAFLTVTLFLSQVIGGIVRVKSPVIFEYSINMPWILYSIVATLYPPSSAFYVVGGLVFSFSLVNIIIVLCYNKRILGISFSFVDFSIIYSRLDMGFYRTMSAVAQIFFIRAYLIVSFSSIMSVHDLDKLAFSLSIAEAVWQLCMILPNRFYSNYVSHPSKVRVSFSRNMKYVFLSSFSFFFGATFFVYLLTSFIHINILKSFDFVYFISSSVLLVFLTVWTLMKYALWAGGMNRRVFECECIGALIVFLICLLGVNFSIVAACSGFVLLMSVFRAKKWIYI